MADESPNFRWIIAGIGFINLTLAYGATYYSFSVFFAPLVRELNWNRSTTAGAFSVFLIVLAVVGPFAGNLVDRFGPRVVFLLGSLVLGAGLALCSLIHWWWEFYAFFSVLTAIGLGFLGFVPNATMIQHWFREKRGLAVGIISSGIGFGIFVCVPSIQYLIDRVGWRMAYRIVAVFIPLLVSLMVLVFLREAAPQKASRSEDRQNTSTALGGFIVDEEWASRSWSLRQAMNTRQFWLLWVSLFLSNFTIHAVLIHQVPFFIDRGLSALFASYIAGIIGMVSIVGKIAWGGLSDKIGREFTYLAGTLCSICGMILLVLFTILPNSYIPYFYAVFFGLGYAAVTALSPLITADFFEGRAYGSIFGTVFMSVNIGGACGVWFMAFIYDRLRSYVPAFFFLMLCNLCALFSILIAAPRKIRRRYR